MSLPGYKPKWKKALWVKGRSVTKKAQSRTPPSKNVTTRRIGRSKGIGRVSKVMGKRLATYRKLRKDFLAKHPLCSGCGPIAAHCGLPAVQSWATEIHHRFGRANKLLNATETWVGLCNLCHTFCHNHPEAARKLNLIAPKGHWNKQP